MSATERYPFSDFLIDHRKNSDLSYYIVNGHYVYVLGEEEFLRSCRYDDGGMIGVQQRNPRLYTVQLDSFEAKSRDDHAITVEDLRQLVRLPALAHLGLITIQSMGPTQVVLDRSLPIDRRGNILSGSIFETKPAALERYYKRRLTI